MSRISTGGGASSDEDLSSPPKSPVIPSHLETQRQVSYPQLPDASTSASHGGEKLTLQSPASTTGARAKSSAPRKPRKKKDATQNLAVAEDGNGTSSGAPEVKEKKTRKPRSTSGASTTVRKRQNTEDASSKDVKKPICQCRWAPPPSPSRTSPPPPKIKAMFYRAARHSPNREKMKLFTTRVSRISLLLNNQRHDLPVLDSITTQFDHPPEKTLNHRRIHLALRSPWRIKWVIVLANLRQSQA